MPSGEDAALDPQVKAAIAAAKARGDVPWETLSVDDARTAYIAANQATVGATIRRRSLPMALPASRSR